MDGRTKALRIMRPLATRDFRLLWAGQVVSTVGDGMFTVALVWQVYRLSDRPAALSLVLAARSIPTLLLVLVAGAVTDRVQRRHLLLAGDVVRGVAVGGIAILAAAHLLRLWHLAVLGALGGAASAFFLPAYTSITPELLEPDLLLHANALESASRPLAGNMIGPALGGLVMGTFGAPYGFAIDAVTFGVSAVCVLAMRSRSLPASVPTDARGRIREGYRYVRAEPWLRIPIAASAFAIFFTIAPFQVLMPLIVRQRLGGGVGTYGFLITIGGIGAIGAATLTSQFLRRIRMAPIVASWSAGAFVYAAMGASRVVAFTAALAFLSGVAFQFAGVTWATVQQRRVPSGLLGRVKSLDLFVSSALFPLAYAFVGPVAGALGPSTTLVCGGTIGGLVWVAAGFRLARARGRVEDETREFEEGRCSEKPL